MNNNPTGVQTVPLGDALQRVAIKIYNDTNNLLLDFKKQDPELRTTELRVFLTHTKAKLLQLLCLVRWLSKHNVNSLFNSILQFNMDLTGLDGVTLRNLDEMYFIHGSLFPLRSNQHEVILARHLMVKGDYLSLPRAAQFAGRMPLPRPLPASTLQSKMNIFLKAKLALLDPLPTNRRYKASVENGLLHIVCENVFTLDVTLQSLSRESDWMVVHFVCPRLFAVSHGEKDEKNDMSRNDIIQLESHLSKLSTTSWKLKVLLQTAEHVSNRIQMQDLYLTLRDKKRSLYHHLVDLKLDQQVDCHRLLLFFWRSEFTRLVFVPFFPSSVVLQWNS